MAKNHHEEEEDARGGFWGGFSAKNTPKDIYIKKPAVNNLDKTWIRNSPQSSLQHSVNRIYLKIL